MKKDDYKLQEDVEYKRLTLMYGAALRQLESKLETISEEFKMLHKYNPIEHMTSRIKTKEGINNKLKKKGLELTHDNLVKTINDVAGLRIICSFIPDIYKLVDMIENMQDITVIKKKDYVSSPKESGYSSYHMIASVPVSVPVGTINVKVEIQIRTMAMDFWSSLEHKMKYKPKEEPTKKQAREWINCAKAINKLDAKMMLLNE